MTGYINTRFIGIPDDLYFEVIHICERSEAWVELQILGLTSITQVKHNHYLRKILIWESIFFSLPEPSGQRTSDSW